MFCFFAYTSDLYFWICASLSCISAFTSSLTTISYFFWPGCCLSHLCQDTTRNSALDVASGVRSLPFSPPLPHRGPDQSTHAQVNEPGHGPAVPGQHQEASGYGPLQDFFGAALWHPRLMCIFVWPFRYQEELWSPHIRFKSTKETRDGVGYDDSAQDEACSGERLWYRWASTFYAILSWKMHDCITCCDCRYAENGELSSPQGFSLRVQRSAGRGGADRPKDPGPASHCAGRGPLQTSVIFKRAFKWIFLSTPASMQSLTSPATFYSHSEFFLS